MKKQDNIAARVVWAFGGLTRFAEKTGWPVATIQYWPRCGKIPSWRRNAIIEAAKRHKVKLPAEYQDKVS